jgi:hypothetical protein
VVVSDKNKHFVEDHPMTILNKFDSNWPSGFRENHLHVKFMDNDNGPKVMTIHDMTLWVKRVNNILMA